MTIKSKLGIGIAAVSLAASFAVSSPANAQTVIENPGSACEAEKVHVRRDFRDPIHFQISSNSPCNDLNIRKAHTALDQMLGWYQTSDGTWNSGSNGWVYVGPEDDGLDTLLTRVVDGTTVYVEGKERSQYATAVT